MGASKDRAGIGQGAGAAGVRQARTSCMEAMTTGGSITKPPMVGVLWPSAPAHDAGARPAAQLAKKSLPPGAKNQINKCRRGHRTTRGSTACCRDGKQARPLRPDHAFPGQAFRRALRDAGISAAEEGAAAASGSRIPLSAACYGNRAAAVRNDLCPGLRARAGACGRMRYGAVRCSTVRGSAGQCGAVRGSAGQCGAVRGSAAQCGEVRRSAGQSGTGGMTQRMCRCGTPAWS